MLLFTFGSLVDSGWVRVQEILCVMVLDSLPEVKEVEAAGELYSGQLLAARIVNGKVSVTETCNKCLFLLSSALNLLRPGKYGREERRG